MRNTAVAALLLAAAPFAFAASGFKKAYFGATKPGTWAKYLMHSSGGDMKYTYTRLPDDAEQPRIEIRVEMADNPPTLNRYTLKKGFAIERDLMDYGPAIVAGEIGAEDAMQPLETDTLVAISKTIARYGKNAKFLGNETVAGKKCDHYAYTIRYEADPPQIENGEIWLNDGVPFGLVKQTATTKDDKGTVISSYEQTLVDAGAGK